ncbi:MAG: 3-octaprenyl-4-hydroxybenzoate carboxy-lyase [Phycisphaerae bacterium]|nr:3-octaprenyl-4-hydroxybenzoate carboxy-lyase [Phycisphaerae bacterium]
MSYPDLQSFLTDLEARGQLKRVRAEVDPVLEISAIADRVSKSPATGGEAAPATPTDPVQGRSGGHGLLFERVKGSRFPVAINVFGSYERMRLALGVSSFEVLADRVQKLVKPEMPTTLIEKMKKLPELAKMAGFGPKVVKRGMCQQVVREGDAANLLDLPLIQCWPHDGRPGYGGKPESATEGTGRYVTFAGIYTRDPESGERNVGMYRVQAFAPRLAAMHWHMHHDGARHFRKYKRRGERMPLAIVLGGEPVLTYAATCPLPPDVSELLFAGFLNDGGIELVPCKTVPMEVPVNAEFVIEGWVDPVQTLIEGPFGDHTGFYSLADRYPAFHVTAITHRENPVYLTTIVGKPPMEDYYLGKATERVFLPLLRMLIPDIVDYDLPMFGAFHNCVFVSIRKEYPMQARKVIHSIWGAGQMMFSKMIVVVDEHVDVHDPNDVFFHVGANVDWRRDTVIADGPCDVLDHATPYYGTGAKIGIDATRKIAGEGVIRDWPEELEMSADIKALVARRWREYGL